MLIYLSPPYATENEKQALIEAADSGWIAPVGPQLDDWENTLSEYTGKHVVLLNSGTAALHLTLIAAGVQRGDRVFVSTHTCNASVNPIKYVGAEPYFIDSELKTWNIDPELLRSAVEESRKNGVSIGAIVAVDIYGMPADWERLRAVAQHYEIPLIQDSAEAMGSVYKSEPAGTQGDFGVWSFNGNKLISTSGGGALICPTAEKATEVRNLASQAKEQRPFYWHEHIGFSYRLSNLLAGFGHAQWENLDLRLKKRKGVFDRYVQFFEDHQIQIKFQSHESSESNRWLPVFLLVHADAGELIAFLKRRNIEARHLWTPMHLQPVFAHCKAKLNGVSESLFQSGICLPTGYGMTDEQLNKVFDVLAEFLIR